MYFSPMINTWLKVLTNPRMETFQAELDSPQATQGTALRWLVVSAVIVTVLGLLRGVPALILASTTFLTSPLGPQTIGGLFYGSLSQGGMAGMVTQLWLVVLIPLFYFLAAGFFYQVARLLGGKGEFGRYAYLLATFYAPLGIICSLVPFVPGVAFFYILVSGLYLYQIFLSYRATKVALNLSSRRAFAVVITPALIYILFVAFILIAIIQMLRSGPMY